jgi:hypothetical protein
MNQPSQLNTDLAALLGFAAGNRTRASEAINQAKQGLGIDKLTRLLTDDDRAAIVQWHKERLTNDKQTDIETIAPAVPLNEVMPAPVVETIPPAIADDTAITERYDFNAMVQLSVYVADRKQAHIAIDGFYLNALMTMTGIDKKGCKDWIQAAVDSWTAFDAKLNITKQVRCLIVRELESQLIKARG